MVPSGLQKGCYPHVTSFYNEQFCWYPIPDKKTTGMRGFSLLQYHWSGTARFLRAMKSNKASSTAASISGAV